MAIRDSRDYDDRPEVVALLANLKASLPQLETLRDQYNSEWEFEDRVYRFYHMSFWKPARRPANKYRVHRPDAGDARG